MSCKLACIGRLALIGASLSLVSGCTLPIEIGPVQESTDFRALDQEPERAEFEWAALAVAVSPRTARRLRSAQSGNVNLRLFRCSDPEDYYPAAANLGGEFYDYVDLPTSAKGPVILTFHLPRHVQERDRYDCAKLDARGYSPIFYESQTVRMPAALHFKKL